MATDKNFGLLSPEKDPDQVLIADALTTVGPSASVTLPVGRKGVQVAVRGQGAVSATVALEFSAGYDIWTEQARFELNGTDMDSSAVRVEDEWMKHRIRVISISGMGAYVSAAASGVA